MRLTSSFSSRLAPVLAAVLALLAACKRDEIKTALEPSKALGTVLAEEAVRAAGANTKIAIITHDDKWGPPSSAEQTFRAALARRGFSCFTAKSAYLGNLMLSRQIGLQPGDFFEAVQNAAGAGALVSFAGAPLVTPEEAAQLPPGHPPILIIATATLGDQPGVPADRERLTSMLDAKIIQIAIVNGRSDSATSSSGQSDAVHEMFNRSYSILRQPR